MDPAWSEIVLYDCFNQKIISLFRTISAECIFAGQFFDDLCDYYQDYENVQETITQIFHTAEQADPKQKFLLICLQYDSITAPCPTRCGGSAAARPLRKLFAEDFLAHLKRLAENT